MTGSTEYPIKGPFYLSRVTEDDVEDVVEAMNNLEVINYLAGPPHLPYTESDALRFISFANDIPKDGIVRVWAIRDRTSKGKLIGSIAIRPSDDGPRAFGSSFEPLYSESRCASIGFWLHPNYHRLGIMSSAVHVLIHDIGIKLLGIYEYEASSFAGNYPSRKTFEKNGFTYMGFRPNKVTQNHTGKVFDSWEYYIDLRHKRSV